DCDKVKAGFTSIQMDDELNIFKERMRSLIVPPHLANGEVSTRPLKNVVMYFKDTSAEDSSPTHTSTSNNNKAVSSGSGSSSKQKSLAVSGELEGTEKQEKFIEALQKWWRCETHSGTNSPVYCYSPSGSNICYPLNHSNIAFWALEILDEKETIDWKPIGLLTHNANPRMQSAGLGHSFTSQLAQPVPSPYRYPPPSVIVLPLWGGKGSYQG
ncbi:hypothetical protein PAXRUDRAFT_169968, partial [Paxillus rubicundulus Ve08.2h10]